MRISTYSFCLNSKFAISKYSSSKKKLEGMEKRAKLLEDRIWKEQHRGNHQHGVGKEHVGWLTYNSIECSDTHQCIKIWFERQAVRSTDLTTDGALEKSGKTLRLKSI